MNEFRAATALPPEEETLCGGQRRTRPRREKWRIEIKSPNLGFLESLLEAEQWPDLHMVKVLLAKLSGSVSGRHDGELQAGRPGCGDVLLNGVISS